VAFVLVRSPAVRAEGGPLGSYSILIPEVKGDFCCFPNLGNPTAVVVEPGGFSCAGNDNLDSRQKFPCSELAHIVGF
jgi:hypothetical protein